MLVLNKLERLLTVCKVKNIDDIDFSERECVVHGKGDKERKAYFDAKTKIHLLNYIESRTDNNIALFVSLNKQHSRLTESGVEL